MTTILFTLNEFVYEMFTGIDDFGDEYDFRMFFYFVLISSLVIAPFCWMMALCWFTIGMFLVMSCVAAFLT